MALSSAFRASAILHLDVTYMLRQDRKFVFTFHKLHKRSKYRKAHPPSPSSLDFFEYKEDSYLCVATTLNKYIRHTYQRRTKKRRSELLLSFI